MKPPDPQRAIDDIAARLADVPDRDAMLAAVFALAPFPMQVFDASGRSVLTNAAFRELFIAVSPPEYNVLRDELLAASGALALVRRAFAGEVVTAPAVWYDPRQLRQASVTDARGACISTTMFPLFDRAGRVTHVVVVAKDETDAALARERLEAERNAALRARRESEASSVAKDEFLAMLGHELRNPLAPIVTALEVARLRGSLGPREQEVIDRQVGHLGRLVDDLLDVSRITRGKVELRRAPRELWHSVERAVEMASPLLERNRHELRLHVPRRGLVVDVDEARAAQVFANLLTNAARYTPPGGVVEVSAARDGDLVRVSVRDNGVGVDPALLPRLFDLFVQGPRRADRAEGGLGLGLALVRSLVELHGGAVRAESEGPGLGSTFVVELPAAAAVRGATPAVPVAAAPRVARARLRVLVVDDNADAAELLGEYARMAGHEVAVAVDGPQALRLTETWRPDVAVLDIGLPVMDGYELGDRLRALHGPDLRLVAVTGYGQERDRQRSRARGFDAHLVKPAAPDAVLDAVERRRG